MAALTIVALGTCAVLGADCLLVAGDEGGDAAVCSPMDPATATVVTPTAGHCETLSVATGAPGCRMAGASYLVRAGGGVDFDVDIVISRMSADYVSAAVTSSDCRCSGAGEIADPPGDWRTIATIPADGTAVAIWSTDTGTPGGGLYACVHGDRPPALDGGAP